MKEYAELKVDYSYDRTRDYALASCKFIFTSRDGKKVIEASTAAEALTALSEDGWELVTSVGFPFMGAGGEHSWRTYAMPSQVLHTLVKQERLSRQM